MFYTIYKITNKINGKQYIGKHQTKDLDDSYMGSGKHIIRAIKKYGIENFTKEILFIYNTENEMNCKEKELVTEEYCKRKDTYNLCPGGQGGFGYINANGLNILDKERKLIVIKKVSIKISSYRKERCKDPFEKEHMKNISKKGNERMRELYPQGTFKDRKHVKETIEQMKETHRKNKHQQGEKNSQFGTCWVTNNIENKKIKKEELDVWIKKGYNKGRMYKNTGV